MIRKQIVPAVGLLAALAIITGLIYPAAVWAIGQATMSHRANGSFIERNGKVVGSPLIGQNFLDDKGNPLPKYFQPRPSSAGTGYDASASAASNLGPGDPRLIGFVAGVNTVDFDGKPSKTNPFATRADPTCVPTDADSGDPVTNPEAGQKYAKADDGTYVCDANTVPQRVIAYRQLNGLPPSTQVPVDAVTGSNSGLDPDISVANAEFQAARVASARGVPVERVKALIADHTQDRRYGVLGEVTVNVLDLNLALDGTH